MSESEISEYISNLSKKIKFAENGITESDYHEYEEKNIFKQVERNSNYICLMFNLNIIFRLPITDNLKMDCRMYAMVIGYIIENIYNRNLNILTNKIITLEPCVFIMPLSVEFYELLDFHQIILYI